MQIFSGLIFALTTRLVLSSELHVIKRRKVVDPYEQTQASRLDDRDTPIQSDLANQKATYLIDIYVGTPGQRISVEVDSGSSDLWVPVTQSIVCSNGVDCAKFGSFNPILSSTVNHVTSSNNDSEFNLAYSGGDLVYGEYLKDSVGIGGATLTQVQFAAATNDVLSAPGAKIYGIMGTGYDVNEAVDGLEPEVPAYVYPNIISEMVMQNFINSRAYSVWLNDPNSPDGSVCFGGIDTEKFDAPLITVPITRNESGVYSRFSIPLTSIKVQSSSGTSSVPTTLTVTSQALIDSGTTVMVLTTDLANGIYQAVGATLNPNGYAYVPCQAGDDPSSKLTFEFNGPDGPKIDVPLSNLLQSGYSQDSTSCIFLVQGTDQFNILILGDAFMRSAYVVFDMENNEISMAQAKINATASNLVEIQKSGIPSPYATNALASASASGTFTTGTSASTATSVIASGSGGSQLSSGTDTSTTTTSQATGSPSATGSSTASRYKSGCQLRWTAVVILWFTISLI